MWLALDTATDQASVALGFAEADALEENLSGARQHASQLLAMIDSLLRRRGAVIDDITGLVVSDGPGSFTGLRVGASVAKALERSRRLPLWTAPSLLVRAAGVAGLAGEDGLVIAVANALRGEVYAAAYRFTPAAVAVVAAPSVWHPAAFRAALDASGVRPAVVVGDVPSEAADGWQEWSERPMIPSPGGAPQARYLIGLVGRPGGATRVEDVAGWEPAYGRPAEAQVRWEATHGRPLPDPVSGSYGRA